MVSYKFSGHLNSNLYVRADNKIFVTQLWSRYLVPLIEKEFSDAGLQIIRNSLEWDQCLNLLLEMGAVYLNQNRIHTDIEVDSEQVLRIHLMPKRYDIHLLKLDEAIIFENPDFLLLNKPARVPVHPTLDNDIENILFHLQQQRKEKIFPVHRLDVETSGLMIFAKNEKTLPHWHQIFSSTKNENARERLIKKKYKAVTSMFESRLGLQHHWMVRSAKAPKMILNLKSLNTDSVKLLVNGASPIMAHRYSLVDLELLTGKTHQIRAQLSHLGSPLVGDKLYGGSEFPNGSQYSHFLLHAYCLEFLGPDGKKYQWEILPEWEHD